MNLTCATLPYGDNEFTFAGLTEAPSRLVAPPRVAESPVNFECKVTEIVQIKSHTGVLAKSWLVLGEAFAIHIDKKLLKAGVFQPSMPASFCVPVGRLPMQKLHRIPGSI